MKFNIDLNLPIKLQGLYEPRRYKILYGGRGGGKSHGVAQTLLDMSARQPLRVLCAREIQKSMRDSVHRLLVDQIHNLNLSAFYAITDNEIRGLNGSLFLFVGLLQHTIDSIKSYEGIDIVWVEEGQSVSKKSWDVLIPTIRKPNSEIWVTINPNMDTDETYQRFIANESLDTWLCKINWRDNPWFPHVLEQERQKTQTTFDKQDYANIWEGVPRTTDQGAIYRYENVPYDPILPVHTVWDLGWNDAMSIGLIQRGQQDIRIIDYIENSHRTLNWYVEQLEKKNLRFGLDFLPHDGRTRNFQTGKSTEELLRQMGRKVHVLPATNIEEGIRAVRMILDKCYFDQNKTPRLIECLKRYRRNLNSKTGEPLAPVHDEYSHGADMFRYLAQSIEYMHNNDYTYTEPEVLDWRL